MRYRFCPHCQMRYVSSIGGNCPHCGRALTESGPGEAEGTPPDESEAAPEAQEQLPSATRVEAEPARAPSEAVPPEVGDGQFRCPHCGEALYRGEQVCWNCGRRVEPEEQVAQESPQPPATRQVGDRVWRAESPTDYTPPLSQAAMHSAYWSLGLGLASVLTCGVLCFLGPVAVWLGIRAVREGAGPVAVVGLVLGAMGTLLLTVLLAIGIALLFGLPGFSPEFAACACAGC